MRIKDYKCKCGCDEFFFHNKTDTQVGIYCEKCGKWLKWADKNEKNLRRGEDSYQHTVKDGMVTIE